MNRTAIVTVVLAAAASVASPQARQRGQVERPAAKSPELKSAIDYRTPQPDGSRSCACNELLRRVKGLEAMLAVGKLPTFASAFADDAKRFDAEAVAKQLRDGQRHYDQARGKSYEEQERLCGTGGAALGDAWEAWQPFLSQNQLDSDFYSGVKASHPDVPNDGDQEQDHRGRHCRNGQYWEEDRALWAINGREGICEQRHYQIHQLLNGSEGDRGYRCYEYRLK